MECQICFEAMGDHVYSLPCGHCYCGPCTYRLPTRGPGRSWSVTCPSCRDVTPWGIGRGQIRRIFLNQTTPTPDVQSLQDQLAARESEVESLRAQLAEARVTINVTLPAKEALIRSQEREIREAQQDFSDLALEYHQEVADHRRARARIDELQEHQIVAQPVSLEHPTERATRRGDDIRCIGRRRPQETAVPECTASDGYHEFSGAGSNKCAAKYRCKICNFSCSEPKPH
ncbi:hypothetical protein GALMADRAFT_232752 [Galerina marginata CBS 339.88]|uniref:RING-type domain-containing protein n=1 Tax=Galerina marginata (strain CBS 339.88) TaxID=685588 RepID=A0A067S5I4_GALM3|nr:hypothetical protein GALMADRAFT_232752 [Galerina marginata CBS 339.88]